MLKRISSEPSIKERLNDKQIRNVKEKFIRLLPEVSTSPYFKGF